MIPVVNLGDSPNQVAAGMLSLRDTISAILINDKD